MLLNQAGLVLINAVYCNTIYYWNDNECMIYNWENQRIVLRWILVLATWTQGSGWVTVDTDLLPWSLAEIPLRNRRSCGCTILCLWLLYRNWNSKSLLLSFFVYVIYYFIILFYFLYRSKDPSYRHGWRVCSQGFQTSPQPTESTRERTCCWSSRKQFGQILSSFLFYFWLVTKDNSRWRMWCHRGSYVTSFWSQKKVWLRMVWDIYSESRCTSLRKDKNALIQLLHLILPVLQPPFKCLQRYISVLDHCPESDSNENTCLPD